MKRRSHVSYTAPSSRTGTGSGRSDRRSGSTGRSGPEQPSRSIRRTSAHGRVSRRRPAAETALLLLTIIGVLLVLVILLLPEIVPGTRQGPDSSNGVSSGDPVSGAAGTKPAGEPGAVAERTTGSGNSRGAPTAGTVPPESDPGARQGGSAETETRSGTSHGPDPVGGPDTPSSVAVTATGRAREPAASRGVIAVVIDDVGYNLHQLEPFLAFPGPITFSVLPELPYTRQAAERVQRAGKAVMLHQPMEAVGGADPGPGAIYRSMGEAEALEVLRKNLEQIPGLRGVNNHQGSAVTADERLMRVVLAELSNRDLVFLDSLTTADSAVERLSQELELPYLERNVFLDNDSHKEAILSAIQAGLEHADRTGRAVLIGHVWSAELAEALIEMYPFIVEEGYDFSYVPELLAGTPRNRP